MAVKPIPEGYHSVTPYLCVKGAAQAIEFYKKAVGAEVGTVKARLHRARENLRRMLAPLRRSPCKI